MKKILIIDDEPLFCKVVREGLDTAKYEVSEAVDGVDGLKKVEEVNPDLILLDIMMPNLDGMGFLKQLNEKYGKGKIPVIITSNLSTITKISEGLALGVKGYIIKSNESIETIARTIDSILEQKPA
ncbi:response regulator [Candidatus Parcubacteria bacterium]|nr:response regulator [Candidatus Parcubacteria bacterium]